MFLGAWGMARDCPACCTNSASSLLLPQKSSPRCPVIGRGQMMKVQVPAAVVRMPIRGIHQHLNPKSKKKENLLQPSRRRTPNSPAKLLLSYLLVLKGKCASKAFRGSFAQCVESRCSPRAFRGRGILVKLCGK